MRAARNEDGKTYYVPADMTYREWENLFVDKTKKNTIIEVGAKSPYSNELLKYNSQALYKVLLKDKSNKINECLSNACKNVAETGYLDGNEHLILIDLKTGDIAYTELGQPMEVG